MKFQGISIKFGLIGFVKCLLNFQRHFSEEVFNCKQKSWKILLLFNIIIWTFSVSKKKCYVYNEYLAYRFYFFFINIMIKGKS